MSNDSIAREDILIEVDELLAAMQSPDLRILDATLISNLKEGEPDARARYEAAHIPGAAFLDHAQLSDSNSPYALMLPPADQLETAIGNLGISNDTEVIVYAQQMIAWATRIWWLLRYAGHDRVRVLNGGLPAWQAAGGATESGTHSFKPTKFEINVQPGWFVDRARVQEAILEGDVTTVNTLSEEMYDLAHIAGSKCQPCSVFLDNDTTLLPNELLLERIDPDQSVGQVITYCGGGVAATVNGVVHKLVGNPEIVVYDGSMSEWLGEKLPLEGAKARET